MAIVLADGPPSIEIKGEMVTASFTSGGDFYAFAFRLADANAGVAEFINQLEKRDGREANIVAYRGRA